MHLETKELSYFYTKANYFIKRGEGQGSKIIFTNTLVLLHTSKHAIHLEQSTTGVIDDKL